MLSESDILISWFAELSAALERIGCEAGPLSQSLYMSVSGAGVVVELLGARVVRTALKPCRRRPTRRTPAASLSRCD